MQKSLNDFPLMTKGGIQGYMSQIVDLGVSEVARSKRGFLYNFFKYGKNMLEKPSITPSGSEGIPWWKKRENFIKRHLVQYKKNKTLRRKLALIAWAYLPH